MKTEIDLRHGDCIELMRAMPDNSVDSVVTDPPYGLSFMGKAWDKGVPSCEVWKEALRVLKPGGHLLAFAGTRTQHRMACAIEDAGFEIRDMIAWVYGSGFPKSLDVSKAIDKAAGAEREEGVEKTTPDGKPYSARTPNSSGEYNAECSHNSLSGATKHNNFTTLPATEAAKQWDGWGTALKPALEPITVARKPLAKGNTVAKNVLEWGTGAINVDGCRVGTDEVTGWGGKAGFGEWGSGLAKDQTARPVQGRWPANLIHDGSQEVLDLFPGKDDGSAARFFYCAKASKKDRDEGCEGMEEKSKVFNGQSDKPAGKAKGSVEDKFSTQPSRNHHPTVKPTALMQYLCRLVTPPNGTVLDPFMGSGSTGKAAVLEGFNFIGCELDAEYIEIAKARVGFNLNKQGGTDHRHREADGEDSLTAG